MDCPKCHFKSSGVLECPKCGIVFSKIVSKPSISVSSNDFYGIKRKSLYEKKPVLIQEEKWKAFLPILAFLCFPLMNILIVPKLIFGGIQTWYHEFGHALIAWFGGRAATPFVLWTNIEETSSWYVFACFLFLMCALAYKSFLENLYFLLAFSLVCISLQFYFFFFASFSTLEIAITHNGVGGELYLSTICIMAYHYRFPEKVYWDVLRYVSLFAGAYIFIDSFTFWLDIQSGQQDIPWGSAIYGAHDPGGDMNRLYDEWGWRKEEIILSYVKVGYFCLTTLTIHYLVILGLSKFKKIKSISNK